MGQFWSGESPSASIQVDAQANDGISSFDSSGSSTLLKNDAAENKETTEDDATPKSKKVIITDFVSSDFTDEDTHCGQFTTLRETAQKRVQQWNCSCDLFPALLKIEGSPDKNGIALAIINCHGFMYRDNQYLAISDKSTCKRCVSPIPLAKVMAALDYTQKNTMCALFACRVLKGTESGYDSSSDTSSLATRFVSLLMPCGPGSTHTTYKCADPMRHLLLNTLSECQTMREVETLHGKFNYARKSNRGRKWRLNETPIEVIMTDDWMRNDEMNDDGLTPPDRSRMEELTSHERLMALFSTYINSKESHKKRCCALTKLRFHVVLYWEELVATQSSEFKTGFLNDILKALEIETDDKLIDRLVQVIVEAALNSIDRTTGFQTWSEIVRFSENAFNTGSVSLKMKALSILSKVPNLFGRDVELPLFFMKSCMEDSNMDIQSVAMKWLFAVLRMKEEPSEVDLSPLIPILMQRSEERMIEKNFLFIRSLENLAGRFRVSFPNSRSSAISLNNMVVLCLTEQKEKIRRRRENIVHIITILAKKDETRAEIAQFIIHCSNSTNSSMKIIALSIVSRILNVVDCSEAPSFFARMLNDEDSSVRSDAAKVFPSYTRQVKNEDIIGRLSNLIPVVIETIKGIDVSERRRHCYSLLLLIEAHPRIINAEHIRTVVEFYMRIDITNDDQWEKNRRLQLNWDDQGQLLIALKESNVLETAIDIAHSFIYLGDWKEKCMGLQGLVAIAIKGSGRKEEHIEQIIPLLTDPNPRVRSYACLALVEIACQPDSEFKEITYEMIIPSLTSALKDEIFKVVTHAARALRIFINSCPKEILLRHLNPIIEETLKLAQNEMIRIRKSGDSDYLERIMELLSSTVKRADCFDAMLNPDIMGLLKNCFKKCIKNKKLRVEYLGNIIDCISLVGRNIGKETFLKDVGEMLLLLVRSSNLKGRICKVSRWCEIIGSDFASLLPHIIKDIVQIAFSDPHLKDCVCGCGWKCSPKEMESIFGVPNGRLDADEALTIFAKTLGVHFAPHVDEVFKAAQHHLKDPSSDWYCWAGEIFPLLLVCLDAKGVDAKRDLWTKFWPAVKMAVKERNNNDYSAKVMNSIARSIEVLGSEGISEEEKAEIGELIEYEVEALTKRRQEKDDDSELSISESSSADEDDNGSENGWKKQWKKHFEEAKEKRDKEWNESKSSAIEALKDLCNVGEKILGLSLSINDLPLAELTGDDGAEESNLPLVQESSDDEIITAIE